MIEEKIIPYLKKHLTKRRLDHVRSVIEFSEKLALRHGLNSSKARLAAALHDTARCWSEQKLIEYVRRHRLSIPGKEFILKSQPILLHSYVGADLAKKKFGVKDRDVLSAIEKHSLGSTKMSDLDKCIYIADLASPDREFKEAKILRKLALKDLDSAYTDGLSVKMFYLIKTKEPINPYCIEAWNHAVARKKFNGN